MIDLVKFLLVYYCTIGVHGRYTEQLTPHRIANPRQDLAPGRIQRMDPDVIIGVNPDTKTAILFLGDMLCAYYTQIGDTVGMARYCSNFNTANSKTGTTVPEKDLQEVKCDYCKVFGDNACSRKHCVLSLTANSLPIISNA